MADQSKMSPAELRAFMTGNDSWGTYGSADDHQRYSKKITGRGGRRKCHCGCGRRETHRGFANGVCLTGGCELSVARWVKDPNEQYRARRRANPVPPSQQQPAE